MELFRRSTGQGRKFDSCQAKMARITRKPHFINFYHIKSYWSWFGMPLTLKISLYYPDSIKKWQNMNKEVKIFGYYPENGFPDQYTAIRFLTCLKKKEVNFFYLPGYIRTSESFIKTKFDVLIDINFKKHFPLVYITSLSQAGLKVGLADSQT